MIAAPITPPARSGIAFSRERDARIVRLGEAHPVTAEMLVRIQWFPSKAKALRRLGRLVRRGRLRVVGTVSRRGVGRPEHVYCRWRPKGDDLLHEVELTEVCLVLHAGRVLRGPRVCDADVRPDAEVWINGEPYYLELDRGSMGFAQMQRRFAKYRGCPHLSLWVCPGEARRDGLRARAEPLRHTALFATLADVLASPHGPVWLDVAGGRAALPRDVGNSPGNKAG